LKQVHSQILQNVTERVDLAFKAFFRRVKAGEEPGYPGFKGCGRYDSFTYPQAGSAFKLLSESRLQLSKIGAVKIKLHRPIEGAPKTLTIRRDRVGNWYACFLCEVEPKPLPPIDTVVGIDVGLASFATYSNGEKVAVPRFFRKEEKALAKAQRRLSKAGKGTPERAKRRKVVAHIHRRIANKRRDFAHKLSRQLVNAFGVIAFEDLKIVDMKQDNYRSMNKSIGDAAWRQLVQYTAHKAEEAGRRVVLVNPRNTSRMCSRCGQLVEKDLSVRVHNCHHCGLSLDRDESLGSTPGSPSRSPFRRGEQSR
jgi:putative transposase